MIRLLVPNWWTLLLRGAIALFFGLTIVFWPGMTLTVLVSLVGAFILLAGLLATIAALRGRQENRFWPILLVEGVIGLVAGMILFLWPKITVLLMLILVGAWAVVTGVFEIVGAIRLRGEIQNEWLLLLSGFVSVLFGAILTVWTQASVQALLWIIGIYAIVSGILNLSLAFQLRRLSPQSSR